jgi:hypothetical protein
VSVTNAANGVSTDAADFNVAVTASLFAIAVTTQGKDSDSVEAESNNAYTQPDTAGTYLGAVEGDADWTLMVVVTNESPFLVGTAHSIDPNSAMSPYTVPDPDAILWGPDIAQAYPY